MAELYPRPGSVGKWTTNPNKLEIVEGQTAQIILWGGGPPPASEPLVLEIQGDVGAHSVEVKNARLKPGERLFRVTPGAAGELTVVGVVPSTGAKYTGPLKLVATKRKVSSLVIQFDVLWSNHPPHTEKPCKMSNGKPTYENQCAIRMGIALAAAGVNMNLFTGLVCGLKGHKAHSRSAPELANWLSGAQRLGTPTVFKPGLGTLGAIQGLKGIVYCVDFYGENNTGDHIDSWNGIDMKAGSTSYFDPAKEVWFWHIKT